MGIQRRSPLKKHARTHKRMDRYNSACARAHRHAIEIYLVARDGTRSRVPDPGGPIDEGNVLTGPTPGGHKAVLATRRRRNTQNFITTHCTDSVFWGTGGSKGLSTSDGRRGGGLGGAGCCPRTTQSGLSSADGTPPEMTLRLDALTQWLRQTCSSQAGGGGHHSARTHECRWLQQTWRPTGPRLPGGTGRRN